MSGRRRRGWAWLAGVVLLGSLAATAVHYRHAGVPGFPLPARLAALVDEWIGTAADDAVAPLRTLQGPVDSPRRGHEPSRGPAELSDSSERDGREDEAREEDEEDGGPDVASLAARLSEHPRLAEWAATDHLLDRFVAAVVNVAEGDSPRAHVGFLRPEDPFETRGPEERPEIDPRSYRRYDPAVEVFVSLDPEAVVEVYRRLEPRFRESYRELGYPEGRFGPVLRRAMENLLEVPVVEGPIRLEPRVISYALANNRLEELSPAKKHLIRMGPRNVRRVQEKVRELLEALAADLDDGEAPGRLAGKP